MLPAVQKCFVNIVKAITKYEYAVIVTPDTEDVKRRLSAAVADISRIAFLQSPTNDTWARDFGPITIFEGDPAMPRLCDFMFNGWGLKYPACHDNLITRRLVDAGLLRAENYRNCLDFVLEGGSIDSNGQGCILTTSRCLMSPNRNGARSRDEIEQYLMSTLGCRKVLWLDHGTIAGDDTDCHIDTLARFTAPDTIVYVDSPADTSHPDYDELTAMRRELGSLTDADGNPFTLVPLPYAGPTIDADGNPLPATYANFLITPRAVFVPVYGLRKTDDMACSILGSLFPGRDIVPVDCRALICQHGSLHCVTMQLY